MFPNPAQDQPQPIQLTPLQQLEKIKSTFKEIRDACHFLESKDRMTYLPHFYRSFLELWQLLHDNRLNLIVLGYPGYGFSDWLQKEVIFDCYLTRQIFHYAVVMTNIDLNDLNFPLEIEAYDQLPPRLEAIEELPAIPVMREPGIAIAYYNILTSPEYLAEFPFLAHLFKGEDDGFEIKTEDIIYEIAAQFLNSEIEFNQRDLQQGELKSKSEEVFSKKSSSPLSRTSKSMVVNNKKSVSPQDNKKSASPNRGKLSFKTSQTFKALLSLSDRNPDESEQQYVARTASDLENKSFKTFAKQFGVEEANRLKQFLQEFLRKAFLYLRIQQYSLIVNDPYKHIVSEILRQTFFIFANLKEGWGMKNLSVLDKFFVTVKNFLNQLDKDLINFEKDLNKNPRFKFSRNLQQGLLFREVLLSFTDHLLHRLAIIPDDNDFRRDLFSRDSVSGVANKLVYFSATAYREREKYRNSTPAAKEAKQTRQEREARLAKLAGQENSTEPNHTQKRRQRLLIQLGKLDAYLDSVFDFVKWFSFVEEKSFQNVMQIFEIKFAIIYHYMRVIEKSKTFKKAFEEDTGTSTSIKNRWATCVLKYNLGIYWLHTSGSKLEEQYFEPAYYEVNASDEMRKGIIESLWKNESQAAKMWAGVKDRSNKPYDFSNNANALSTTFSRRNFFSVTYRTLNLLKAGVENWKNSNAYLVDTLGDLIEREIISIDANAELKLAVEQNNLDDYVKNNRQTVIALLRDIANREEYSHQFPAVYGETIEGKYETVIPFPSSPRDPNSYDCHRDGTTILARKPNSPENLVDLLQALAANANSNELTILSLGRMGEDDIFDYNALRAIKEIAELKINIKTKDNGSLTFTIKLNKKEYTVKVYNILLEDSTDLHLSENGREQLQAILKYAPNLAIHCASGVGRTGMVRMIQAGMQFVVALRMLKAGNDTSAIIAKLLGFPETVLNEAGSGFEKTEWTTQAKPMLWSFLAAMDCLCKGELLHEDMTTVLDYFFTRLLAGRRQLRFSVQEQVQMNCVFREVAMYHARMNLRFNPEQLQDLDIRLHKAFHPGVVPQETVFVLQVTNEDSVKYQKLFEQEQNPQAVRAGFLQRTFSSRSNMRQSSVVALPRENPEPATGFEGLQRLTSTIASVGESVPTTTVGRSINPRERRGNIQGDRSSIFIRRQRNLDQLPTPGPRLQSAEVDNHFQTNVEVNPHLHGLFRGYENDAVIRTRMSEYLELHPGLAIGRVDDRGDCFFEAIAFAWNQQHPDQSPKNGRDLRIICSTYANNLAEQAGNRTLNNPIYRYFLYRVKRDFPALENMTPEEILQEKTEEINKLYDDYIENIQFTITEINAGLATNGRSTPIWGEMELDGLILSQELGINIEVIGYSQHNGETTSQNEWIVPAGIVGFEFGANVHPVKPANLDENTVIHLAVANLHFVPLVKREYLQQVDPQSLENPECLPGTPKILRDTVDFGRTHFFGSSSRSSSSGASPSAEASTVQKNRAPSLRSSSSSDSE